MVSVQRHHLCQHNICSDRHPDLGSSCCTLFSAQLGVKVLLAESNRQQRLELQMDNVQAMLWSSVKQWDEERRDGAMPMVTLNNVCQRQGVAVTVLADDVASSRATLKEYLGRQSGELGVLVTGTPCVEAAALGDTFLVLQLETCAVAVDSHRHSCGSQPATPGTVIAEASRMADLIDWVFEVLLVELKCSQEYVSTTTFKVQASPLSSNMSLGDWVRQLTKASGPEPAKSAKSPAAKSPSVPPAESPPKASGLQPAKSGAPAPAAKSPPKASGSQPAKSGAPPAKLPPKASGSHPAKSSAPPAKPPPASSVARPPVGVVECAPVQAVSREHACIKFNVRCARCQWDKHRAEWQQLASFIDPTTGQTMTPIVERPEHLGGEWAIGCSICAKRLASGSFCGHGQFARFNVRALTMMRRQEIQSHCRSPEHLKSIQLIQAAGAASATASQQMTAVCTTGSKFGQSVPRPDRFVWAIQCAHRGSTFRDFAAFCKTNDLTNPMTSISVCRDSSRQAGMKMVYCVGAVINEEHQALIRRSARLSFAIDERDQVFVMRARVAYSRPRVGSKELFIGLVRDYGYDTADSVEAIWKCFQFLCTVRKGRRHPQSEAESGLQPDIQGMGSEDYFDEELLAHICKITIAGASDGCQVALNAVQEIAKTRLVNLRYQFRDRPHTTRTCMKGILKYMNEGHELLQALISGKQSFAKRAKHSRRFQGIWMRKQTEEIERIRNGSGSSESGSQPGGDLFAALQNLAYAEHRFDSRSTPMAILCSRFGAVIEVLLEMAADKQAAHLNDRRWAETLLQLVSGDSGLQKLIIFGLDADFAVATQRLIRVQDGSQPDLALTTAQVAEAVEVVDALFKQGQVFLPEAEDLYTSQLLVGLGRLPVAARSQLKWPDLARDAWDLTAARRYANTLATMTRQFYKLNFPEYAWRNKFGAFNCGPGTMPLQLRLGYIVDLAKKEGLKPHAVRSQFLTAMPHMKRLYKESGDNREAWAAYADRLGRRGARESGSELLPLILTYISLLDGTSDVERMFARLELTELKRRERHMSAEMLTHTILTLEAPDEVDALVTREAPPAPTQQQATLEFMWRPCKLLLRAMAKYAEFWGTRRYASRCVELKPMGIRRQQKTLARIQPAHKANHVGLKAMKRKWTKAAKAAVKRAASFPGSGSQPGEGKSMSRVSRNLQKTALVALKSKRSLESAKFQRYESTSGLAPPVAPLRVASKRPRVSCEQSKVAVKAKSAAIKPKLAGMKLKWAVSKLAAMKPKLAARNACGSHPAIKAKLAAVKSKLAAIKPKLAVKPNLGAPKVAAPTACGSQPANLAFNAALATWALRWGAAAVRA